MRASLNVGTARPSHFADLREPCRIQIPEAHSAPPRICELKVLTEPVTDDAGEGSILTRPVSSLATMTIEQCWTCRVGDQERVS